jgi:hypothetical protein
MSWIFHSQTNYVYTGQTSEDPQTSTSTSTSPFPDDGYNCTDSGAFPHPTYCEYYYDCTNGVDTLIKCPRNFLFDLQYFGCNYPELTHCQERDRPEGVPGTINPPIVTGGTPPPGVCGDDDFYALYPDPDDCTSFYQCSEGVAYHMKCPWPLLYNIEVEACDFQLNVDCGDRPIPTRLYNWLIDLSINQVSLESLFLLK